MFAFIASVMQICFFSMARHFFFSLAYGLSRSRRVGFCSRTQSSYMHIFAHSHFNLIPCAKANSKNTNNTISPSNNPCKKRPHRCIIITMSTKPKQNAQHAIERLLTTETSSGKYCTGSEITKCPIPSVKIVLCDEDGDVAGCKELSFPLDANSIEVIKDNADRAGVGVLDQTVVNLDVRKT